MSEAKEIVTLAKGILVLSALNIDFCIVSKEEKVSKARRKVLFHFGFLHKDTHAQR